MGGRAAENGKKRIKRRARGKDQAKHGELKNTDGKRIKREIKYNEERRRRKKERERESGKVRGSILES